MKTLLRSTLVAAAIALIAGCSMTPQPRPLPTATPVAPTDISLLPFRLPDCADAQSEQTFNIPGLDQSGDLVMCNPHINPIDSDVIASGYLDETLFINHDGSFSVVVERTYPDHTTRTTHTGYLFN